MKKTINLWAINQLYTNTKSTHSFSYFLAENGVFSTFLQEKEVQGLQSFLNLRKQTIIISYFLKAVFHKFYLVHSWIPWSISFSNISKRFNDYRNPIDPFHATGLSLYTPWNIKKYLAFWCFLGSIDRDQWYEMGYSVAWDLICKCKF